MRVFKHSSKDIWLVAVAAFHIAFMVVGTWYFSELSPAWVVAAVAASVALVCTNYQCVAHNFLHLPFFSSTTLNHFFGCMNTLSLGAPQELYRAQHLNHHRFNNDQPDSQTLETRDRSSLYRGSPDPDQPVGLLSYVLRNLWRTELSALLVEIARMRRTRQLWAETATQLMFFSALCAIDWRAALLLVLPGWALGYAVALAENYAEHFGAKPGSRLTDSVSCYGAAYNLIWFNNGYHQEHHHRPQVHWTLLPLERAAMLPESERRVVRGWHGTNLLLALFDGVARPSSQAAKSRTSNP